MLLWVVGSSTYLGNLGSDHLIKTFLLTNPNVLYIRHCFSTNFNIVSGRFFFSTKIEVHNSNAKISQANGLNL